MIKDTIEEVNIFPPKPEVIINNKNQFNFIISLIIFLVSFYFILGKRIDSIVLITVILLIHELGHFLAMRFYKYNDTKILFLPFIGALTSGNKNEISQKQQLIVIMAGPTPGIIIGMVLFFIGQFYGIDLLIRAGIFFQVVNLFNLLPIFPLDGGRIIDTIYLKGKDIIFKIFIIISIVVLTLISIKNNDYFLLIIPLFLILQLIRLSDINKIKLNAEENGIEISSTFDELSDKNYWLLRDEIGKTSKAFSRIISPGYYEISSDENKVIAYINDILKKEFNLDLTNKSKLIFIIIWLLFLLIPSFIMLNYFNIL